MSTNEKDILIIEDDEILNSGLCYNLQQAGMNPHPAYRISEGRAFLESSACDLILLDVNMPDGNGFDFAREIADRYSVPFLFITAHNLEEEIISGLRIGAGDYITKPFSIKVVIEKVRTILKRYSGLQDNEIIHCGSLEVSLSEHTVRKNGEIIPLTPTEFELLSIFLRNRTQLLTKNFLMERVWDSKGNYVNDHTVSLNVSRLRSKIADENCEYIRTIYGLGYKWTGDREEKRI